MHVLVFVSPVVLYSSLCGLSFMNINLLWFYASTNSRIDQTEKIALCYFSTNS